MHVAIAQPLVSVPVAFRKFRKGWDTVPAAQKPRARFSRCFPAQLGRPDPPSRRPGLVRALLKTVENVDFGLRRPDQHKQFLTNSQNAVTAAQQAAASATQAIADAEARVALVPSEPNRATTPGVGFAWGGLKMPRQWYTCSHNLCPGRSRRSATPN